MTTERSDALYASWKQSAEKFDYFILAVLGALCAYISQSFTPEKIGINPGTFELLALLILVLSIVFGFKRIESVNQILILNHQLLHSNEMCGILSEVVEKGTGINRATGEVYTPEYAMKKIDTLSTKKNFIEPQIAKFQGKASMYYNLRNGSMFFGFMVILFAKLFTAYAVA